MKTKIVEMHRHSQYKSWEEAHNMGGVYVAQVPEDTPYDTIAALVKGTRICMSADDPVVWRVKPVELTPFQKAFIKAYHVHVAEATSEQVEQYLRGTPKGMTSTEIFRLHDYHQMFEAGLNYSSKE
jgi:hypothetical protein